MELAQGVTGYVFELEASGPYEAVKNADGTTTSSSSEVGPEGHWAITQVYVALKDGGFAMAQVAVSEAAGDEERAAAQAAVESLKLADADAADKDAEAASMYENVDIVLRLREQALHLEPPILHLSFDGTLDDAPAEKLRTYLYYL